MLSRISSTWALDDLALVDRRQRAVVHLHHRLVLVGRIVLVVDELGAAVGKRAKLRTLRVALLAALSAALSEVGVSSSVIRGNVSPESRVIFARRAESEGTCVPIMATHGWPPGHSPVGQIGANLKSILGQTATVNRRCDLSYVRTVSYGPRQRDDPLHLLFLRQIGRVDQHGVGRLDRLRRVRASRWTS